MKKNISETGMEEGPVEAKLKEILRYNKYDQIYVVSYHYGRLLSMKTTLYGWQNHDNNWEKKERRTK